MWRILLLTSVLVVVAFTVVAQPKPVPDIAGLRAAIATGLARHPTPTPTPRRP